ncbi:MAG: sulfotransferase [Actinomycetota bacterium]|nr:sulfotransferase [Actinomycetota bacterium]
MTHRPPFPLIVGCGRSGTTLLTVMLDSHPDLAIPAETGGFVLEFCGVHVRSDGRTTPRSALGTDGAPAGPASDAGSGSPEFGIATTIRPSEVDAGAESSKHYDDATIGTLLDELERWDRYRWWGIDREQAMAGMRSAGVCSRTDVVRGIYAEYARNQGKHRYGDKTPNHVLHMTTLADLFPEAVFVHLVRDGRSVALALRDTSFGPRTITETATYWAQRVNAGRAAGHALGDRRYIEIRYEDLVADPERALRQITARIDLDFDPAMLDYAAAATRQLDMSPKPAEDRSLAMPLTRGLRDWRTGMSPADAAAFELLAGRTLRRHGYPLSGSPIRLGAHVQASVPAVLHALRWHGRALAGRLPTW